MTISHLDLLNTSIQAALASIEVYNKPDVKYREQTFTILNINAWELLLKAKILKDNNENIESLYIVKNDGIFKSNRSGNPLTIEIIGAMKLIEGLDKNVGENLKYLIEIRDTAIHFYHDVDLAYTIYILAVASLTNYQKLVNDWFGKSLLEYNFYILPLSFAYSFQTLTSIKLEKKPEVIANLIRAVSDASEVNTNNEFQFVCEISAQLVSAKKLMGEADLTMALENSAATNVVVVEKLQRLTDKYPYSYRQLWQKIKSKKPAVKQNDFNNLIKKLGIKTNPEYSDYSFPTKKNRDEYEKSGKLSEHPTSIYNEEAIRLIINSLP